MTDEEQLELPLTSDRRPPQAVPRRQARNVQQALAALKAKKVRQEQQIVEAKQAAQRIRRSSRKTSQ